MKTTTPNDQWFDICELDDIVPSTGRCALFNDKQVAIFRLKQDQQEILYAIDNFCPFSHANILSRGIVGSVDNTAVVASPLYKQHFQLENGLCVEDPSVQLNTYKVRLNGNTIQLAA